MIVCELTLIHDSHFAARIAQLYQHLHDCDKLLVLSSGVIFGCKSG